MILALLLNLAHAVTPSAEEAERLAGGDVVLRTLASTRPGTIHVLALVDARAEAARVWAALLDFPGRMQGNSALRDIAAYRPATATEQWVRWTASRFGFDVTYHNHYVLAADRSWMTHELDPEQENDLRWSRGTYRLTAVPVGTRLEYDVESDFGAAIPTFIQRWLTGGGVRDFMADIARRAEGR